MAKTKRKEIINSTVRVNASNKVGGLKITLPKKMAKMLGLKVGDELECFLFGDHIEIYSGESIADARAIHAMYSVSPEILQ